MVSSSSCRSSAGIKPLIFPSYSWRTTVTCGDGGRTTEQCQFTEKEHLNRYMNESMLHIRGVEMSPWVHVEDRAWTGVCSKMIAGLPFPTLYLNTNICTLYSLNFQNRLITLLFRRSRGIIVYFYFVSLHAAFSAYITHGIRGDAKRLKRHRERLAWVEKGVYWQRQRHGWKWNQAMPQTPGTFPTHGLISMKRLKLLVPINNTFILWVYFRACTFSLLLE